ncbi:SUN domain-containing protein 1 isoform X2 [Corythoichthys intestinalis]|uniref:SUN domain-containing protein 1 isoform X2 n=1 Tax=Corythoichthys intestinalis TaxID=161448 RepID=UPI0025A63E8E|nr:SUN domain-containing protein 1 isoform X2 [Corythoichthys intestinalis]
MLRSPLARDRKGSRPVVRGGRRRGNMQEESKQRRMTMDFSQLHTYTPPQCAPENTGYTYSLSSSYSTAALEFEKEHQIAPVYESPRMSRRSLRLQALAAHGNDDVPEYLQNRSQSSYAIRKESQIVSGMESRGRKLHSSSNTISLSLSQADTPRKNLSFSAISTPVGSSTRLEEGDVRSDVGLHSTLTDRGHLRQRTFTSTSRTDDGIWGRTYQSEHRSSNINGDIGASTSHASHANGYICKDCSFHCEKNDSSSTHSSPKPSTSSHEEAIHTDPFSYRSSFHSRIYSPDQSQKRQTGVLTSVSNTCARLSKKVLAPFVSIFTVLTSSVVWLHTRTKGSVSMLERGSATASAGVLTSCKDSLKQTASSSLSQMWLLKRKMMGDSQVQAHSSYCGSMNVKDLGKEDASHLNLNGSLCDDCKGKQYSETQDVLCAQSSRFRRLLGAMRSLLAYTGYWLFVPAHYVSKGAKALGSGAGALMKMVLSLLWTVVAVPAKAGRSLLWFIASGWYRLVSLMSLLNVFFLTRCLPKLWKLRLLLLPLLLLLAWWLWAPSSAVLLGYFPPVNVTQWHPSFIATYLSSWLPASAPDSSPDRTSVPVSQTPPLLVHNVDSERLERLERQLAQLWERVQQSDKNQERHQADILAQYANLKEKLHSETDKETLGLWVSSLLERRLDVLRGELERGQELRVQSEEQLKTLQGRQTARLDDLESQLGILVARTEVQQLQKYNVDKEKTEEAVIAPAVDAPIHSEGVKQEEHDALVAEVQRLELDLAKIREDLSGVVGCKGKCEQLDSLQATVSAQVSSQIRKELQALFYGEETEGQVPESLLAWLARQYVSAPDLHASLTDLERRILSNVSRQLELSHAQTLGQAESKLASVVGSVRSDAAAEGLSEEQVKVIVQNALKLYSQDKTGLVDYALESGGGSILSTRCSETHETKTALMSLFGLPLWYFSQSPRVVIQPDVYPGNCWAFKGSQGYLVIRLSVRIRPTSFCLEHIPKALSPTGNISSAPQNFTVFGLDDEYQEEGQLLGRYIYREDGESLQTFPVQEVTEKSFQIVEVRVLSNWGHPDYTCLYRFRVHGEPRPQ